MITIHETLLPSPTALSVRVTLQAGTAQYNTQGNLVQDGMREKRTVDIAWTRMSLDDLSSLAEAMADPFFDCAYPDPLLGNRTMRCRCTGKSASVFQYRDGVPVWADVKITLEEQ
ncbi:MAG: hypothetical protein IJ189_05970 [Clostridia bacterium]|nr:hypothetical protein [Clostridia bacterium]